MYSSLLYVYVYIQVRGNSYLTDQRKVDPGPAMAKLMLMELYTVEAKVCRICRYVMFSNYICMCMYMYVHFYPYYQVYTLIF